MSTSIPPCSFKVGDKIKRVEEGLKPLELSKEAIIKLVSRCWRESSFDSCNNASKNGCFGYIFYIDMEDKKRVRRCACHYQLVSSSRRKSKNVKHDKRAEWRKIISK